MDKDTLLRKIGQQLSYSIKRFPGESNRRVLLGQKETSLMGNCRTVRFRGYSYAVVSCDMASFIGVTY